MGPCTADVMSPAGSGVTEAACGRLSPPGEPTSASARPSGPAEPEKLLHAPILLSPPHLGGAYLGGAAGGRRDVEAALAAATSGLVGTRCAGSTWSQQFAVCPGSTATLGGAVVLQIAMA